MRLSDENLHGRTVVGSDGIVIGEVSMLFLDGESLRVESLQVKLHKTVADQLGADHSIFRAGSLEIPVSMVQSIGDAVVLSVAIDELRQVLPSTGESAPAH